MLSWDLHDGLFVGVEAEVEGLVVQPYDSFFSCMCSTNLPLSKSAN